MAEQFGIRLSVDTKDLLANINRAIDSINSSGSLKSVKIGVDTSSFDSAIKRLKTELASIAGKSSAHKIELGTSRADGQVTLDELNALKKVEEELANQTGLVAVQAEFSKTAEVVKSLTSAVSAFKKEYSSITGDNIKSLREQFQGLVVDMASGNNTNVGKTSATEALKQQKQEQEKVAKSSEEAARKIAEAEKRISDSIQSTNELLRVRDTIYSGRKDIYTSETYGDSVNKITKNLVNGNLSSAVSEINYERQRKQLEQNYAAASKLASKLEDVKVKYADINGQKPITNADNLNDLNARYNSISETISKIPSASAEMVARLKADTESQIAELERLIRQYQNVEYAATSLRTKDIGTIKADQTNEIEKFTQKIINSKVPISEMTADINALKNSLNSVTDKNTLVEFLNQFDILKSKFSALNEQGRTAADISKQIDKNINGLDKILNNTSLFRNKGSYKAQYYDLIKTVDGLKAKYVELQNSLKNDSSADSIAKTKGELTALETELKNAGREAANLKSNLANVKMEQVGVDIARKTAQTQAMISDIVRKNAYAMGKVNTVSGSGLTFGQEIKQLSADLSKFPETVDKINSKVRTLQADIKTLGYEGNTALGKLVESAVKFVKWTGMTLLITKVRTYIRKLFTTVYELDTSLIDLRKTFKGTNAELEDFYFEANKLAKQMGVTTQEIISQGAAWSRLSYSTNEAMKKMAEMSSMFAAISPDMNVEQAQNGLVSIMKAFDIDPENVLDEILSKVNIIGNTAATSNGEIVTMLEKSSSAMKEANNTLEQTIALETAAVEVSRDAPGTGVAYKTIAARLRGLDEETLEVIDDVEILSGKLADAAKTLKTPGGISLFTDETKTTFKSTYQIIKELSEIWNDLTDVQNAKISEILGGKRQSQIVAATINNFKAAEEALKNMENSAGSAEAEMETIRESAEYAMNALKETFTSLAQHSVSRGGLKDLINAGTQILEIVDGIVSKIGLIPTIITTIVGIISAKKLTTGGIFGKNEDGKLTIFGSQVSGGFKSWWSGLGKSTPEIKAQRVEIQNATSAIEKFHKAFQNGTMTQQAYNNVLNSSNRIVRDYVNALQAGASETDAYTAAHKRLNSELQNIGRNGKTAGVGTKAAAIGMKALNTAGSMLLSIGISFVLNTIMQAISDSINSLQNSIDKVKELTEKEKSLKSEIEELNKQLGETKLKIEALEKLPKLTFMQQEELDKLKETNDELERQIRLKRGELASDAYTKNEEAKKVWKDINVSNNMGYNTPSIWETQKLELEKYKKMLEEIKALKESPEYKSGSQEAENLVKQKEKERDDLHDKIQGYYSKDWDTIINGLDPKYIENKKIIDEVKKVADEFDNLNKEVKKSLTDLYNDGKYAVVKQYLDNLAKDGKLTAETFDKLTDADVDGIEAFKEELKEIEGLDTQGVVESIIEALKESGEKGKEAADGVKEFKEQLEELQDKIDSVVSKQEKLAESYKKIGLGAKLSAKEAYDLVKDVPEIAKYLEKDGKEFTISQEGYKNANKELYKEIQDKVSDDYIETREQRQTLNEIKSLYEEKTKAQEEFGEVPKNTQYKYDKLVNDYKEKYKVTDDDALGKNIDETLKKVNDNYEGLSVIHQMMNDIFDGRQLAVDSINEGFNRGKEEIDKFNKNIQTLDSAIKALNEETLLSYDEMNELVELSPELQDSFVQQENGYSIAVSALEDLRNQSYETRNKYIDDLLAEVQAEMSAAEETKRINQEKCGYINEYGEYVAGTLKGIESYVEKLAAEEQVQIADAQIEALKQIVQKLKGLRGDITYDDDKKDKKSLSEEMQEQIDYYKMLISAVDAVRNRYTEAIDSEIDALNDSKDALKETNDERQRELDLIEARNNLENAKKRKVWVYSEANGFQQVQDEKAVKEAEEKYRNAIQEAQEAAIDKQIDEREKKKKAIEKKTDDITGIEGEIEDSKNIAQALAALGLSEEKDLLNLSDSVKQGIKEGLAEALLTKEQEENKDNSKYVPVSLDDVLKHLGASVTSEDINSLNLISKNDYSASQKLADNLKAYQDENINSVVNNNSGGMIVSPTFYVNGVTDPNEVAKVVNSELTNLFTKINNSIKPGGIGLR